MHSFAIDAIRQIKMLDLSAIEFPLADIEVEVNKGFGIFRGTAVQSGDYALPQSTLAGLNASGGTLSSKAAMTRNETIC